MIQFTDFNKSNNERSYVSRISIIAIRYHKINISSVTMASDFTSVFQSYQEDGRVIIQVFVQWNHVYS